MTATPARIGFILQANRTVTAENATVKARYGSLARTDDEPIPSFYDNTADAQIVADERLALLDKARRRFDVIVQGLEEVLALPKAAVVQFIDTEMGVDQPMLVSQVELDFANQRATLELWG